MIEIIDHNFDDNPKFKFGPSLIDTKCTSTKMRKELIGINQLE